MPVYLSADELEWDKGPVSEEEMLVAKDMQARKLRRIQRAESRRLERREMAKAEPGTKDQKGWGCTHLNPSEKEGKREKRANSIH